MHVFILFSAFGEFVTCKYLYVSQDCGHDAARFLQQHLDRISSPLIHEHCAHYTYASDACVQVSRALPNQISNVVLLSMMLFMNLLHLTHITYITVWIYRSNFSVTYLRELTDILSQLLSSKEVSWFDIRHIFSEHLHYCQV